MSNENLAARLKTFALILKYGHDLFDAHEFSVIAAKAVNDSCVLLNFRNAVLFEMTGEGKAELIAQFAQTELHPHAAVVLLLKQLAETADFTADGTCIVSRENGLPEELGKNDGVYLCCKLSPPNHGPALTFVWLLEYEKEVPVYAVNTAKLLGRSISEALIYSRLAAVGKWKDRKKIRKFWGWLMGVILLAALMFVPVPDSATAEFSLKSNHITAAYAWFDGPIAQCLKQDGDSVRKNEIIVRYDTAQLQYRLAIAKAALRETEAELKLEQQNAFTDETKLGKVELLKAKRESMFVAVQEAEWFLRFSEIKSPADGILALTDGRAELLTGKAVRTGDKLFEIMGKEGLIAEILVNERDASVLQKGFTATLFLYTAPEKAIRTEILEVANYPELTEQRTYCFPVRVRIVPEESLPLRFGMRGVAKLSAGNVPLGYYLFKSMILYFRSW